MKAQPLICVRDVEASSRWYCTLLGATSGHGGPEYERVMVGDDFVLQLHAWDVHDHPALGDRRKAIGNGHALWFEVDDVDAAWARAKKLKAEVLEPLALNPSANHFEFWVRDPDGWLVVLAGKPRGR